MPASVPIPRSLQLIREAEKAGPASLTGPKQLGALLIRGLFQKTPTVLFIKLTYVSSYYKRTKYVIFQSYLSLKCKTAPPSKKMEH